MCLCIASSFVLDSAIDWFLDRCITALNITGDTVVSCIIAQHVSLEDMQGLPADAIKQDIDVQEDKLSASAQDDDSPDSSDQEVGSQTNA